MLFTVYKTTNILDGKIYVGMHRTFDLNDGYLGSGKLLRAAIKKHGIENFKKEILHVFDNEKSMIDKEIEIVTEDFVASKTTYNACIGGYGGGIRKNAVLSNTTKEKIRKSVSKFYKENPEHIETVLKQPRRKLTKEEKNYFSKIRSGKLWVSYNGETKMILSSELMNFLKEGWVQCRDFEPHNKGTAKPKIRKTAEEMIVIREQIRQKQIGRRSSPESITKRIEKTSNEYLITTPNGKVFRIKNLNQFCRENGLKAPTMCAVLKGLQTHHKGYKITKLR